MMNVQALEEGLQGGDMEKKGKKGKKEKYVTFLFLKRTNKGYKVDYVLILPNKEA